MSIQTKNLILAPHLPRYLRALLRSAEEFENTSGLRVADGIREQLLSASPEFMARVENSKEPDPWLFGFAVIHKIDNVLIGMCGFPGPPNSNGVAEIAYGIAPDYQRRGYATEAATALIQFATSDPRVKMIWAHTLTEKTLRRAFWKSAASRKPATPWIRKIICRFGAGNAPLHPEPLAEIKLPADWIVYEKILRALAFNPAFENQIGAIHDRQRFANVVVGN
jgi:RimJ/RimL family protein N-acetyltransferase